MDVHILGEKEMKNTYRIEITFVFEEFILKYKFDIRRKRRNKKYGEISGIGRK